MFGLVTFVYPALLAVLCLGAGLLVDRLSGRFLPAALLPVVGVATLIAVSQLMTAVPSVVSATPGVLVGVAIAGYVLGGGRLITRVRAAPGRVWGTLLPVVAYFVGIAPLLLAGRLTFSGYGVLPDSALHMIGADYLIRHGQEYAHLDLRNSYGQYINAYFNMSYPSGSHTLFGGTARLLDLPLIWALQPFCAFLLATTVGPAWVLVRRSGLDGGWAAVAALSVTVPALVYGYELVASLKEVATLPLILALGALVVIHGRWLRGPPTAGIPFALVVAGGASALGVAFGPWAVAATIVVAALVVVDAVTGERPFRRALPLVGVGVVAGLVAAWPTWVDAYGSLHVAQAIASTSNPGNLSAPLHLEQVFGSWLSGSYRHRAAMGPARVITYVLIGFTGLAALVGAVHLVRRRAWALAAWLGLLLALWIGLSLYGTTWTDAKLLMLTSPVVVLLAWAGVAGVRASPVPAVAPLLGLVLAGGVLASDVLQYHNNDLAPTARYAELASIDTRYAGAGPALFTDFDEWSLYVLRDLDIGGPDFIFPPAGTVGLVPNHGDPVDLDRIPAVTLRGYPLIITRRDPTASRPPSAYALAYEGAYYQVWSRRPGAPAALAHLRLSGRRTVSCRTIRPLAARAASQRAALVTASPIPVVAVSLSRAVHPTWFRGHPPSVGLLMTRNGHLTARVRLPRAGVWNLWLQGEIMPVIRVSVDGRHVGSVGGEVSGNPFNPDTMVPFPVSLAAGVHRVTLSRAGLTGEPGNGGSDVLHAMFLARAGARELVRATPAAAWRSLCGRPYDWIEVTR